MGENGAVGAHAIPDIYVVHQGEAAAEFSWKVAESLRDDGLKVVLHSGGGNFKAQMKKADASGARFAAIIGEDEVVAGQISIKPLREAAEQIRVDLAGAAALLGNI